MKKLIVALMLLTGTAWGLTNQEWCEQKGDFYTEKYCYAKKDLNAYLEKIKVALGAEDVRLGNNPFGENPMTVGMAGRYHGSLWIIVDDSWELLPKTSKVDFMEKIYKTIHLEYLSAITIRKYSTGKELAYTEPPWTTTYLQETWMGLEGGPGDPRPKLPPGLKWAPLYEDNPTPSESDTANDSGD